MFLVENCAYSHVLWFFNYSPVLQFMIWPLQLCAWTVTYNCIRFLHLLWMGLFYYYWQSTFDVVVLCPSIHNPFLLTTFKSLCVLFFSFDFILFTYLPFVFVNRPFQYSCFLQYLSPKTSSSLANSFPRSSTHKFPKTPIRFSFPCLHIVLVSMCGYMIWTFISKIIQTSSSVPRSQDSQFFFVKKPKEEPPWAPPVRAQPVLKLQNFNYDYNLLCWSQPSWDGCRLFSAMKTVEKLWRMATIWLFFVLVNAPLGLNSCRK